MEREKKITLVLYVKFKGVFTLEKISKTSKRPVVQFTLINDDLRTELISLLDYFEIRYLVINVKSRRKDAKEKPIIPVIRIVGTKRIQKFFDLIHKDMDFTTENYDKVFNFVKQEVNK